MAAELRLFVAVYTDEDITSELAPALRERGFEAQSAAEAGMLNADDESQLAYAASREMALLTCNAAHFLPLAKRYSETRQPHSGIIVSSEQYSRNRSGELLRLVLHLLNSLSAEDLHDGLVYLQQFK